ncbi:MAG TPA: hypothetical protein PKL31_16525 [Fulvivirga sp.]|nr:hypothetical protein [Fulvivirga sp.]
MDDIQLILYIAFVVFAIVSRMLKSKKAGKLKPPVQTEQETTEREFSFEDLLKEFTEGPKKEEHREEVEEVFEEEYQNDEEAERIYQESIAATERYEQMAKVSEDRHTGNFKHFGGYSEEDVEEEENEYAELFQDQNSAKRAIILSEIINRKY